MVLGDGDVYYAAALDGVWEEDGWEFYLWRWEG